MPVGIRYLASLTLVLTINPKGLPSGVISNESIYASDTRPLEHDYMPLTLTAG
jgi:hypothetical protein